MPKPIKRSDGKVLSSPKPSDEERLQAMLNPKPKIKIRIPPKEHPVYTADARNTVRTLCREGEEESIPTFTFEDYKRRLLEEIRSSQRPFNEDDSDDGIDMNNFTREV